MIGMFLLSSHSRSILVFHVIWSWSQYQRQGSLSLDLGLLVSVASMTIEVKKDRGTIYYSPTPALVRSSTMVWEVMYSVQYVMHSIASHKSSCSAELELLQLLEVAWFYGVERHADVCIPYAACTSTPASV